MKPKFSVYPAIILASLLGLVVLVLVWLRFNVSIEVIEPETSSLPETVPPTLRSPSDQPLSTIPSRPTPEATTEPAEVAGAVGALRMSNQTEQPVRLALLARRSAATADLAPTYGNPAHWDFAPGEGSAKGLILSLPEDNLKLKKGDILVAFAQDGSRRYWGPYVVGETPLPIWNQKTSEWQLVLQP